MPEPGNLKYVAGGLNDNEKYFDPYDGQNKAPENSIISARSITAGESVSIAE